MVKETPRDVWLVDCSPADIHGSDVVSEPNEPANHASEAFSMPVLFRYMATTRAGSTRVLWIHKSNRNACQFSLVLDEAPKLTKAPRMLDTPLVLVNRYPTADTFEVFKGNPAVGVFSFRNQQLGNNVVRVSCEKRLFGAPFPEQTPCRLCSFALKPGSEFCMPHTYPIKFVAAPRLSVRVSGDVVYAEVNSKPFFRLVSGFFRNFNDYGKIEDPGSQDKVYLSPDSAEFFELVGAELHVDCFSAIQCQNGYAINAFPAEYSLVIDYGSIASENWLNVSVAFVCFCDFANGSDGQLCRQTVLSSYFAVYKPLQIDFVCSSASKRDGCYFIAGFIESFHCFKEVTGFLRVRQQFSEERLLHRLIDRVIQYLKFSNFPTSLEGSEFWW